MHSPDGMKNLTQLGLFLTFLSVLAACGEDKKTDEPEPGEDIECGSAADPFKGTCVETYFAEQTCFDAAGECTGTKTVNAKNLSYEADLAWENGAMMHIMAAQTSATSELLSSKAEACSTGVTTVTPDATNPKKVKYVSRTEWTRSLDEAKLKYEYEFTNEELANPSAINVLFTCPDDSTFRINLVDFQAASTCVAGAKVNACVFDEDEEDAGN